MRTKSYICKKSFQTVNDIYGEAYGKVNVLEGTQMALFGYEDFGKKMKLKSPIGNLAITIKTKDLHKYFEDK